MIEGQPINTTNPKIDSEGASKVANATGEFQGLVVNGVYMMPKPGVDQQREIQEKIKRIGKGQY